MAAKSIKIVGKLISLTEDNGEFEFPAIFLDHCGDVSSGSERRTLGRSSLNDFTLLKNCVSRKHCYFEFKDLHWCIYDQSMNGTTINTVRLKGNSMLKSGDKLLFGADHISIVDPPLFQFVQDIEQVINNRKTEVKKRSEPANESESLNLPTKRAKLMGESIDSTTEKLPNVLLEANEYVSCSICSKIMVDPVIVSDCSHGFCYSCLAFSWVENGKKNCKECPNCLGKVSFPVRSEQLDNLCHVFAKAFGKEIFDDYQKRAKQSPSLLQKFNINPFLKDDGNVLKDGFNAGDVTNTSIGKVNKGATNVPPVEEKNDDSDSLSHHSWEDEDSESDVSDDTEASDSDI